MDADGEPRAARLTGAIGQLHRRDVAGRATGVRRSGLGLDRGLSRHVRAPVRDARVVRPQPLIALQRALVGWGERERRDLPWRRTRDPWAVLVSELMLQQTQAPRVVPKFDAFMERFPTAAACAAASAGDVVGAWAGLGYNRRAINLHRAAVAIVERHGGVVPDDLDALLALPGIGAYTARAVLVFAYERDIGLVDTNAGRFVARALAGRAVTKPEAQQLADAAVPPGQAWGGGQAGVRPRGGRAAQT